MFIFCANKYYLLKCTSKKLKICVYLHRWCGNPCPFMGLVFVQVHKLFILVYIRVFNFFHKL